MERVVIFGAGGTGSRYAKELLEQSNDRQIIAFLDNSKTKQGTKLNGIAVLPPEKISELDYTVVVVVSPGFEDDIVDQLKQLGVDADKIRTCGNDGHIATRNIWLTDFAKTVYSRNLSGNVAEAGVFRGDFAKRINAEFPDRTLYLFDTFEGFPADDVAREEIASNAKPGYYDATSEALVMGKLPHPEKAIVRKGYFPATAKDIDDTFCFVNLDLDLYQPTFEGLKYFYGKMIDGGGVILIHDFFGIDFPNVRTAVYDFERWLGEPLKMVPIGDTLSIAILK